MQNEENKITPTPTKKLTPPSEMTIKQRKWLKLYLELGNATEAAMRVYDCTNEDSAAVIGFENLRKLNIADAMEEYGITDKQLLKVTDEGLKANHKRAQITDRDDKGHPIYKYFNEPDRLTRHKYLETALKLKRRLADKLELPLPDDAQIIILINRPQKNENIKLHGSGELPTETVGSI